MVLVSFYLLNETFWLFFLILVYFCLFRRIALLKIYKKFLKNSFKKNFRFSKIIFKKNQKKNL